MFGGQFATNRPHQLIPLSLLNIIQEKRESIRAFMERFGKMTLKVKKLSLGILFIIYFH